MFSLTRACVYPIHSYKTKAILARHLREHMQGPQICPTCGHVSPNRRALAKHKEIHIPELKDKYKCLVCGKGFRDRIKLKVQFHSELEFIELFLNRFAHVFFFSFCRNIRTFTRAQLVRITAMSAAKCFDSIHRFHFIKRQCIRNHYPHIHTQTTLNRFQSIYKLHSLSVIRHLRFTQKYNQI